VAKRATFAVVTVALGLVLIEFGLRLFGYLPLPTQAVTRNPEILHQYTKFRPSDKLIWELTPGWSGREGPGVVTINSRGLREREIEPAKPAGTFRILCVGDSVTFGHWVEAEEAYPRRLEQVLQERSPGPVQVVNAGVPGYSPFQEHAWLEHQGWDYDPDLVVVGFVLNDVVERYLTLAGYGGANTVLGVDTTVTLSPLARLLRRTAFHRFVTSLMLAGERRREVYSVRRLFDPTVTAAVEAAWEQTEGELTAMAQAARRRGVPLVLALFPFRFQIAEHLPSVPQERLRRWADGVKVPVIDLTDAFVRLGPRAAFLDHDHPTPAGHAAAARALAAGLSRLGLVPPTTVPLPTGVHGSMVPGAVAVISIGASAE
jgi:lysophospholipase L1-like esterase